MIRGFFDPTSFERPVPRFWVSMRLPGVSPRWALVNFLIDTGAPSTALHPSDMVKRFELDVTRLASPEQWSRRTTITGISGGVVSYIEPATYAFLREDQTVLELNQDVLIAQWMPANEELPSVLGWDILRHFGLSLDARTGKVLLEE